MMQIRSRNFLEKIDNNTFYRLMNNPWMNWRKLLMGFAKEFVSQTKSKGDSTSCVTFFVLDDSDIEKTGKKFEFIGRIFNHVTKLYPLGFKLLLLPILNGKSLVATDCSLHHEKGKKGTFGMTKKEQKSQFSKKRDSKSPSHKRVEELDMKKSEVVVSMLKRVIKNGAMHLLGMCKHDRRLYLIEKKELNAHQLITKNERKKSKYSSKCKSTYISLVADYKGVKSALTKQSANCSAKPSNIYWS